MPHKLIIVLAIILPLIGCRDDKLISNNSDGGQETPAFGETWRGTETQFNDRFATRRENGKDILHDGKSGAPVTTSIILLNENGGRWIKHQYEEGLEDGTRTVWDENGKVIYKYLYRGGILEKTLIREGEKVRD